MKKSKHERQNSSSSDKNDRKCQTNKERKCKYVCAYGNRVYEYVLGPACVCKQKCRSKLDGKEEEIFYKFWNLGPRYIQNKYLFGCIKVKPAMATVFKLERLYRSKTINASYSVKVNGNDVKICKIEFMSIHGLPRGRLDSIVSQISRGATTPKLDKRFTNKMR